MFNEEGESIIASSPKQSDQEHQDNFIDCVRSRRQPNASVEQGHYSAMLSHLANVSWRVGNKKLAFRVVQVDWMLTRFNGFSDKNNVRISSGALLRF